jgi:diguanylate cyclase (GGDEF)-like protein
MFEKIYELRRSIDDLTKFARTYVVTKDKIYKENYDNILKIRSGDISKPENYFSVYWDLLKPLREIRHPDLNKSSDSLEKEMGKLPYNEYEYQMLDESKIYIKDILQLENKAFESLENNDQSKAINLLFSKDYHKLKEKVMLPIDKFILSLEKRTTKKIENFNSNNEKLYKKLYILISLGFILSFIIIWLIFKKIINPIKKLTHTIISYKKGEKNIKEFYCYKDEIGFLIKNFFDMKKRIDKDVIKLKYNASHDPLTKIYNRKAFFEIAEEIYELSKRENNELSVLLLDIDHFKKINDTYGHLIGDEVLKFISNNISSLLRKSDLFARYGGEEFIALLPNTKLNDAKKIAQKINNYIYNNPYVDKKHTIKLSISIGIADKKEENNFIEIVNKSDNALYIAKNNGRNCVKVF